MKGIVSQVTKSKSGKAWRVSIDGKWFGAKFDSNIENAVGKPIDFLFKGDPKYGDWIESWAYDAAKPPTPAPTSGTQPQPSNGPVDRFYMPFVSNVVAHAIQVGKIESPQQISQWAKAAYDAAQALDILDPEF